MTAKHVLVVDDDDSIREVATMALQFVGGWQVSTAGSGGEAWEQARRSHPDAVLLDVMMPGMDGPSTVLRLKEDPATSNIPVILLTAKVQAREAGDLQQGGVAGVIGKPFDPMTLAGEISRLLGWSP